MVALGGSTPACVYTIIPTVLPPTNQILILHFFQVYIAEISTASLRGTLGSANQLAVTIGILLSYTVGTFCNWRWLAAIGAIPPALLISLMYFMPETPRWSLSHNRRREALQALLWLRGPEADVEEECYRIEETLGIIRHSLSFFWYLHLPF